MTRAAVTAAAVALLACAVQASAAPVAVPDDSGATVTLPAPARRVIALSPHLTELVYAAGGGDRLVGAMRYSDFPPQAAKLPVVGDAFAVNLETVAALKPDLLLLWGSGMPQRQQQRLRALGVPVYESESTSVAGIADTLRRLGRLLGTAPQADRAADATQAQWAALQTRFAGRPPVRVFYQVWHEPLMTAGGQHLIGQAIRACGGTNVFDRLSGLAPTVSWEAAVAANPQLVLTGAAQDEPAHLEGWQRFPQVDAVRDGRLVVLDGHRLARMTPRFVDAAYSLCEAIEAARTRPAPR